MLYKLNIDKVRKKVITDAMYRVDDDIDGDRLTILCRGKEIAISRGDVSVRLPLQEALTLLDMLDNHYECVRDSIRIYEETNHTELN